MLNGNIALLKYGNEYNTVNINTLNEPISSNIVMECSCSTLTSPTQDYTKFLSITEINKNFKIKDHSFEYYFNKYINKNEAQLFHYGFFFQMTSYLCLVDVANLAQPFI